MITIDQLLESVDLEFEPRFVTKSDDNWVIIWAEKPFMGEDEWYHTICRNLDCGHIKLAEFDGKDWTECIYEVPRKTTRKIGRFTLIDFDNVNNANGLRVSVLTASAFNKLNELVEAVNELKGAKNE